MNSVPCNTVAKFIHVLELQNGTLAHADLTARLEGNPHYDESKDKAESDCPGNGAVGVD